MWLCAAMLHMLLKGMDRLGKLPHGGTRSDVCQRFPELLCTSYAEPCARTGVCSTSIPPHVLTRCCWVPSPPLPSCANSTCGTSATDSAGDDESSGPAYDPAELTKGAPSRHLWLGNLHQRLPRSLLRSTFERFGPVEDVVTFPGRMYAFVNFREPADAAKAAQAVQVRHTRCRAMQACMLMMMHGDDVWRCVHGSLTSV